MHTPMLSILAILACLAMPAAAIGNDDMPPEFTIEYVLKKGDTKVGEMTRSLAHLGDSRYEFQSSSKTTGFIALFYKNSIREETSWQIRDSQFVADEYHYLRVKKDKKRQVNIDFDWERGKIITEVNDSSWSMPIEKPVYDKLLYQIALMYDLQAGNPTDHYRIADGGRMKDYFFEIKDSETLHTEVGSLETVKIVRHKDNRGEDKAVLWCAPDLHYLPVRVDTYDDDGDVISAYLEKVKGLTVKSARVARSPDPEARRVANNRAAYDRLPEK